MAGNHQKLHDEVSGGNLKRVKQLIKQGAGINQTDQDGNTGLHVAVLSNQVTIIEYLIKHGADLEKVTANGHTPLHLAASHGRLKATKVILSHGASIDKIDKEGKSACHIAIIKGNLDVVRYLITKGAKIYHEANVAKDSLLQIAAEYGAMDIMEYLIGQGIQVNPENAEGSTALHIAAKNGHLDITTYLVSKGAEVEKEDNRGRTSLHWAVKLGHLEMVKYLIFQGAKVNKHNKQGWAALHFAAEAGHLEVAKHLILQKADVNKRSESGMTALLSAAHGGHVDVIKYLISQGAEMNVKTNGGSTALHIALETGQIGAIEYLISQGVKVDEYDGYGYTPLHHTCRRGDIGLTEHLISLGADVNKCDDDGSTALHFAAKIGNLDITKYLISQGAEVNNMDSRGWTVLHSAAEGGYLHVAEYLIAQGADVHKGNNAGETTLHIATKNGHAAFIKYLIGQGVDVNNRENDGQNAIQCATGNSCTEVNNYLLDQGADVKKGNNNGRTVLHFTAKNCELGYMESLIRYRADVNNSDNRGWTALHIAAECGWLRVAECLIVNGADVHKGNNVGETALHVAAKNVHLDVIKYLIEHGADVNKEDNNGRNALQCALGTGCSDITQYLLDQGTDVNKKDNNGQTLLHMSVTKCEVGYIEDLIRYRADVNNSDYKGWTALHIAAESGWLRVGECLIVNGADVHKTNNAGETALHIAAKNGYRAVIKYLIEQGADVNTRDNDNHTALQHAKMNGFHDIVEYLFTQGTEVNKGNNDSHTALQNTAARNGHLDVTKTQTSHEAQFDGDSYSWSALHAAAESGHLDVTEHLISEGAKVNKKDNKGSTALHDASLQGQLDVVHFLIGQGADVNAGDFDGNRALHLAAFNGHLDVTVYLLNQGAEVNKEAENGNTALHYAAWRGHLAVTKYLTKYANQEVAVYENIKCRDPPSHQESHAGTNDYVKCSADVDKANNEGKTALHFAAEKGRTAVAEYLLAQGADVNKGESGGWTALHFGVQNRQFDLVKVLIEGGARPDAEDIHGQTPLQLSRLLGYKDITDLLTNGRNSEVSQVEALDIQHATEHGHTPSIEKIVSSGTDLNAQSTDGQTCLHKAIKLCYKTGVTVEGSATLKRISDEFYDGKLSPEMALVFCLLENGARTDVEDADGNLPIQYAKDEVVRQMILSRLTSLEDIKSYREIGPAPSVKSVEVGANGTLETALDDYRVSVIIPPDAIHPDHSRRITVTLLEHPSCVDVQEDESLACCGIKCDPGDVIFNNPVMIRIPHCFSVINPDQIRPDIVCYEWDSVNDLPNTSRRRSSTSPDKPPHCRVYGKHLELYIDRCAEWWVLIPLEQQLVRQKIICTPYIPDKIDKGKKIDVHLHLHANLPGMDADAEEEERKQSYHKAHPSVPINVATKSGDLDVVCQREGHRDVKEVLSLKDIHGNMRNRVLIPVTVLEEDLDFPVTITIVQKGKLDVAIYFAFVFNSSDDEDQDTSVEIASSVRAIRGILGTDIQDVELHSIAEMMSVNHFYDLGIALGFRIPNLDAIEYMQSGNRQQAMYQMLVKWRQAQPSALAAKDALLSVMESLDLPSEDMQISDLGSDSDIQDSTLLTLSKTIKANQFYEVGQLLGLTKMDLQHIKHRTFSNQKDANIQMLYKWKSSQISAEKGMQTLKLVWESIQAVGKTESSEDIMDKGDSARLYQVPEENKPGGPTCESEDMDVICTDMDNRGGSPVKYERSHEDPDLHGGMSNTEELCSVALPVKSLPQVCLLGKSLCLDDGFIVEIIDLQRLAVLHSIARQILDIWWHGLKEDERKNQSLKLLLEYNITKIKEGRDDVLGAIRTTADLLTLCHRVKVSPSRVLQIMSASVTFLPSYVIGRVVMKMLNLWLQKCGTRDRLLAIAQAFRFNDAATKIAEALESQSSYPKFISHCNIDHRGGTLALDQLGVTLSIPEGAIPKGMRSVVTLQVSTHDTPRIPLREGEFLVTPVIETSFKQELLKPCKVVLPHCINLQGRSGDYSTILYAKTNPRTFGRRSLTRGTSNTSKSEIVFHTRHLQILALSSSDCPGVQLRCVVFQPTILTPEEEPRLRVYIVHPYRIYMKHISRKERTSSVSYCQVQKEFQFPIKPTSKHLKIILQDGGKEQKRMMPIKGILSGECDPLIFKLQFSAEEKGYKDLNITIQEDRKLTAEKQISISIEDEPDYAVDNITDSHQHFASNNLLEVLADVIREPKDLTSLGYQLGFSQQSMRKYNDPADVSFDTISRSGFIGMLREWRRRVRPSEQMEELHLALQNAGLEYVTNVILREMGGASRKKFEQLKQEWESRSKKISN